MSITSLIVWLVIGALAGWLAGKVMKGRGFGLLGNVVVGVIGSVIGGYLLGGFFSTGGFLGSLISSFIGAIILIFVVGLIAKK